MSARLPVVPELKQHPLLNGENIEPFPLALVGRLILVLLVGLYPITTPDGVVFGGGPGGCDTVRIRGKPPYLEPLLRSVENVIESHSLQHDDEPVETVVESGGN